MTTTEERIRIDGVWRPEPGLGGGFDVIRYSETDRKTVKREVDGEWRRGHFLRNGPYETKAVAQARCDELNRA